MSNVKRKKVLSLLLSLISIFNVSASASVTEQVTSVENQELNENVLKESKPENVEDIIRREDGSIQVLSGYNTLSDEETVTKAEFEGDKAEILQMISELEEIMAREDVDAWLTYIAPDSIRYYSTPANIRKAQKKLPNKAIVLRGIGDYFKYVFIPAREHKTVNEIRYDSKTNVRAGDADKEKNKFSVVYYFVKVNGKWKVHIPTL